MGVTGPALRRRNHAWLQMRSLEKQGLRLARRDDAEDESESSGDESADDEPTSTARPPPASTSAGLVNGGKGVILLPKPTSGASLGETLGAGEPDKPDDEESKHDDDHHEEEHHEEEHHESDDNSSTTKRPPPTSSATTITKGAQKPTIKSPSATATSTSFDTFVTSLTGIPLPTTTTAPSITVPVTGSTQSGEAEADNEELTVAPAPQNKLSGGAVAGIVLGVLASISLLVGAAFLWRKFRRDRGLPFFPQTRFRLRDDDESSHPPSVTGPLPGKVGGPNQAKTNTQIMDDLMKAAYAAENGGGANDMERAYAAGAMPKLPPQLQLPQPHQEIHEPTGLGVFMDEKAYAALERPPTPGEPKKPVMKWLSEVKTPVQPNGPEIPPTPKMPPSVGRLTVTYGVGGGGRVPEQPRPAYFGRETMTTETTDTSVRWYG